ncbi:hypothetical protein [Streptococcus suis]|uniref:hypothetical protein n=1 Tax=Streptococcus suis TaxID=1307 RepID=UPI002AAD1C35|nr:hypothetical protein [Streptococcus suis]
MDLSRFEEMGYKPIAIPLNISESKRDYLIKLYMMSLAFQYYADKHMKIRPARNQSFYDVLTNTENHAEYQKYRIELGLPLDEYGYSQISSRTLQRFFALEKFDPTLLSSITQNNNFQEIYKSAHQFYFWKHPERLKKIHNRFAKNLSKMASF